LFDLVANHSSAWETVRASDEKMFGLLLFGCLPIIQVDCISSEHPETQLGQVGSYTARIVVFNENWT
jgi:hypothetical protein